MSPATLSTALRHLVAERAGDVLLPHEPDHILAEKHGGPATTDNLALACFHCNRHKGSDIASIDPETRRLTPLFNPRTQNWNEHFALSGIRILPLTAEGRVTAALLQLNHPDRLRVREALAEAGRYP